MTATAGQAVLSVHSKKASRPHLQAMMAIALRGIGVPKHRAMALSEMPQPDVRLPEGFGWEEWER